MDKSQLFELWRSTCAREKHSHGFSTSVMDLEVDNKSFLRLKKNVPKGLCEMVYFTEGEPDPIKYEITSEEYEDLKDYFEDSLE